MPGVTTRTTSRSTRPLPGRRQLLADGHLVAAVDEPGQVVVQGMVGYAGHGDAVPLAHLPGGQGDLQLPGDQPGILVEGLVEIAQPEEDDGLRVALFHPEVLAADGGDAGFAHFCHILQ